MPKFQFYAPLLFTLFLILPGTPLTGHAQTTLLIPSQTSIEEKQVSVPAAGRNAKAQTAEKKDSQSQQKKAPEAAPAGNGNQAAKAGSVRDGAQQKPSEAGQDAKGETAEKKDGQPQQKTSSEKAAAGHGTRPAPESAPEPAAPAAAQGQTPPPAATLPEKTDSTMSDTVAAVNASILACASPEVINQEVDMLIAGMDLFRHEGLDMDMPRIFTVYRFDHEARLREKPVARDDLLGDIEEISYLGKKAWGTNVGLSRRGLYQFSIETRPWWEQARQGYEQQIVKTMLPVYGEDWGWHLPVGLSFEIVPLVCPFGLTAPAYFSATVLVDGKPEKDLHVEIQRINTDNAKALTRWQESITERTNTAGEFGAVLNRPGWWSCRAYRAGAPLKGPNGKPAPLRTSTVFWLYVDSLNGE